MPSKFNAPPPTLPWAPLWTTYRNGLPEITQYGIVAVVDGYASPLLTVGDESQPLWTRSLLKPWQAMALLSKVEQRFPDLRDEEVAIGCASHNGEPHHLKVIDHILHHRLQGTETLLQCPACYPMSEGENIRLKEENAPPSSRYHPCAGKHLFTLLAMDDTEDPARYMELNHPVYTPLQQMLRTLLPHFKTSEAPLPITTDGCGMLNVGLSAVDIAHLFCQLAHPSMAENSIQPSPSRILRAMTQHSLLVGGTRRLDTKLMIEGQKEGKTIVAKEGADGMLGVGIAPCSEYPNGLGICVKLSAGYQAAMLEKAYRWLTHSPEALPCESEPCDTRYHMASIRYPQPV